MVFLEFILYAVIRRYVVGYDNLGRQIAGVLPRTVEGRAILRLSGILQAPSYRTSHKFTRRRFLIFQSKLLI
jgi:hypothetical protein